MEINFGPKKVWNDLVENKESLKYFIQMTALLVVLSIVDVVLNVKIFSSLGSLLLGGYLVLIMNNIIQDKKPVLENLGNVQDEKRNLFLIILKGIGIGCVYGIALIIVGIILFLILSKILMLKMTLSIIITIIGLLPMIVIISICNLLFAENLNFSDAFNIKKAVESFKIAWSKYLALYCINIVLALFVFTLLMVMLIPIAASLILIFKDYPILALTKETGRLIGGILGASVGEVCAIMITYWYTNAVAQVYKYSLSKMNITEN